MTRSPRRSVPLLVLALALALTFANAAASHADVFEPIQLASEGTLEGGAGGLQQALYAHDSVISGNGQYVAFDGYFAGRSGVWRRNLQTGEVQPVAVGSQVPGTSSESCAQPACDSELPSISANGQLISFTTTAQLDPAEDKNNAPDVYERNMQVPESQSGAYTLVSAVNGKTEGLGYEGSSGDGSVAAGRSAMSANGQQVAFVTTAVSNLAACQPGAPSEAACEAGSSESPTPTTPALQVAVRNLVTGETKLVSEEYNQSTGQPVPDKPVSETEGSTTYGATYSPLASPPEFPFKARAYDLPYIVGASISADGSTVAWMGTVVGKQAKFLSDESLNAKYAEPLWRRIADGSSAPTRRVTGGSEAENQLCLATGLTRLPTLAQPGPCQGPFVVEPAYGVWAGRIGNTVPQLSADGYSVAFLATAQLVSLGADFGRGSETEFDDLYVANMHPGPTRNEALRPLTQLVNGTEGSPPIVDDAIAPDGEQVAFSTQRIEFPLGSPVYVSQPESVVGMSELFDVDLGNDTLTRVTGGYEGGPSEHPHLKFFSGEHAYKSSDGALSPSFSESGNTLAFTSTASNLVYGDGNTPPVTNEVPVGSADGSDAFVVARKSYSPEAAEAYVSSAPAEPATTPPWSLGATALSLKNGTVRLYVEAPGAGNLTAAAESAVAVTTPSHATRASAKRGRASTKAVRANAKHGRTTTTVLVRDVASTKKTVSSAVGGLEEITLTLASHYRTLAARAGGLSATVNLAFSAHGHGTLKDSIAVTFIGKPAAPAKKKATKKKAAKKKAAKKASTPRVEVMR